MTALDKTSIPTYEYISTNIGAPKAQAQGALAAALVAFQAEVPPIPKSKTVKVQTKTGGSYTFDYAPYEVMLGTIRPLLAKHKLAFIQPLDGGCVRTVLIHESGEQIDSFVPIKTDGLSMQEIGSAITYMRRYALSAILGLVTDDDDDANLADGNEAKVVKPEQHSVKVAPLDDDLIGQGMLDQAVEFATDHGTTWPDAVLESLGEIVDPKGVTVGQARQVCADIVARKKAEATT